MWDTFKKLLYFFLSCKVEKDICNYGNVLWMDFFGGWELKY